MEIEIRGISQEFSISIVGVTQYNKNGTHRQKLLQSMKEGELVRLIREYDNPYDADAVAIRNIYDECIGYLPRGDRMAHFIDSGGIASAQVLKITGGSNFLGVLFKKFRKNYGCVIQITKHDYDWGKVKPYMDENAKIVDLIQSTKELENSNRNKAIENYRKAIENYRKAIDDIHKLESKGRIAACWRNARNPINRLSLLLERDGKFQESLKAILSYESHEDKLGLLSKDTASIAKRKKRMQSKLKNNNSKH